MIMAQEETTATKRQKKFINSIETLTSTPTSIPTLPFDLVAEILCRLPVNLLLQLRYLCKSFYSLISDPKFAKKHLRMSAPRHHLMVGSRSKLDKLRLFDSPLPSVFSISRRVKLTLTELNYPVSLNNGHPLQVCSCDGILCINTAWPYERSAILWNPSFRNFKILPPFEFEWEHHAGPIYSFGYDRLIDSYKIVVVSNCHLKKGKIEVGVHSLGTNYWRRIDDIPFSGRIPEWGSGIFVSGTINWLIFDISNVLLSSIVSLDLEKESYQMLSQPDLKGNTWKKSLGMLSDCLCFFDSSDSVYFDVWIMKEYGNSESWAKLYRLPPMKNHLTPYTKVLYMSEDDKILVNYNNSGVVVYDYKKGTLKIPRFESNKNRLMYPNVYIESLISP